MGAFVQQVGSHTATATTMVITVGTAATGFSGTTTVGNRVVVGACTGGGLTISSVVDSRGNAWTIDRQGTAASGATSCIASAVIAPGKVLVTGDTITLTPSSSASVHAGAIEISGVGAADQSATAHITGTSQTLATAVNSAAGDFVVGVQASSGAASTITISSTDADSGGTWTDLAYPYAGSTTGGVDIAYQPGSASASLYQMAGTASTAVNMDACIVSYAGLGTAGAQASLPLAPAWHPGWGLPGLPGGTPFQAWPQYRAFGPVAATLTNSFEGGSNGTSVTTANSGGGSGAAFSQITIGAGCTLAYDSTRSAHGTLSCQVATPASGTDVHAAWGSNSLNWQATTWFRLYLYFTANPVNSHRVLEFFDASAATCGGVTIGTTGGINAVVASGGTTFTLATVIPLNQWFRLEGFLKGDAATGQISISLFSSMDDNVVADEVHTTSANQNTRGIPAAAHFGPTTFAVANVGPYWMDDIGLSTVGPLGPAYFPQSYTISLPGSAATAGAFTQQAGKTLAGSAASAAAVTRQASKMGAGTVTSTGTLARQAARSLNAAAATTGTIARQAAQAYAATCATAGTLTRQVSRKLAVTVSTAGMLAVVKAVTLILAGACTTVASLARSAGKTLTATPTTAGSLQRAASRTWTAVAATSGTLTRRLAAQIAGTAVASGSLTRRVARTLATTVTTSGSGAIKFARTIVVSLGNLALRWAATVSGGRWGAQPGQDRWDAGSGPGRWEDGDDHSRWNTGD